METTFAMIKPDAVRAGAIGKIISMIEENGFTIKHMRLVNMDANQAMRLYEVHKEKPFFAEMIEFITSGPIIALALKKDHAIKDWRTLMGATNPPDATEGTIRKQFGTNINNNAVHGSDAPETAATELAIFFPDL